MYLSVDPSRITAANLAAAAEWIRRGGVVAYPTDTFYGLAVDPALAEAVAAVFDLKGRSPEAAVPLLAASLEQVMALSGPLDGKSSRLARILWPGPLSLVVDAPPGIADALHAGRRTVAVRVPSHQVARALAEACGHWITATSANRSGMAPAATVEELGLLAADPRVYVVDGGATPGGLSSTIVDARGSTVELVRAGAVAWSRVLESLQE